MELRKLNISSNKEIAFVENLYIESFPPSERRPVDKMLELFKGDSPFIISITIEEDLIVGFLTYWDLGDFTFVEHFSISPELRNEGYGRKVIELFIKEMNKPILLEVELPTTILSERRIGFYQRLGFKLWKNVQYQQPAYDIEVGAIPMKLMTYGKLNIEMDLAKIREKVYSIVYGC